MSAKPLSYCTYYTITVRADDQERSVSIEAEKIGKEEAATKIIAEQAQSELDKAIPALESAAAALDSLKKKDIDEIKAYAKPPPAGINLYALCTQAID